MTSVAVVRDADYPEDETADPATAVPAAFGSVCAALASAKLPVPASVGVRAVGTPAVTVFIMPGDGRPGMLEDLCLSSVPAAEAD